MISLRTLNLLLADGIFHRHHILAVTVGHAVALARLVTLLLQLVTKHLLGMFIVGNAGGILQGKLQTDIRILRILTHTLALAAHPVKHLAYLFLQSLTRKPATVLEGFHHHLPRRVQLSLHLNTSCIYFAASDGFKFVQGVLGVFQLVIHHDVHHLLHITLDVIVSYAVLHGAQQTLHLTGCKVVQVTTADKHTRQVVHALHRRLVKTHLGARHFVHFRINRPSLCIRQILLPRMAQHALRQVCKVVTDGSHGIHLHRLVSTVFVRQTHSSTGNHLVKSQTAVRPNVFRLVRVTVQIGTFVG